MDIIVSALIFTIGSVAAYSPSVDIDPGLVLREGREENGAELQHSLISP